MQLYNIDLERGILNSILLDNTAYNEISHILNANDFYLPFHQTIFKTMQKLLKEKDFFDEYILKNELEKEKKFDEELFIEISATTPLTNELAIEYAKTLKELSLKRKLQILFKRASIEIENQNVLELINKTKKELENLEKEDSDVFKFADFSMIEDREIEFILKDFLPVPRGAVSLLSAAGGSGKSWLVLQMLLRYINETDGKGRAFGWLSEDPLFATKKRAEKIINKILINDKSTKFYDISHPNYKNLKFLGSETRPFHFVIYDYKSKKINPLFYKLKNTLREFDFIVLDPLIAFFSGDENNNSQAREFMNLLTEWASKENKAILVVHHANKATNGTRGASAFVDAVRLVKKLNIIKLDENTIDEVNREIEIVKDNWGVKRFLNSNKKKIQVFPTINDIDKQIKEIELDKNRLYKEEELF